MAASTTGRDVDRIVGALAPATDTPLLFEMRRSRRGRSGEVAASPIGGPVGAFRQRIRLTGVSEPAILDALLQDLDNGPVAFEVTANGERRKATLAAVDPGATRLTIADLATLTITFEDDDEPTASGIAGADDFAILVILVIVATVAAVGALIVTVSSGEGDCDVAAEGDPPQPNPGPGTPP